MAVGFVQAADGQCFGGTVVEVHRHDRLLFQGSCALSAQFVLRQEVDGQAFTLTAAEGASCRRRPEHQVDVAAGQVEVPAAAVKVVDLHGLETDRQAQVAGEAGGHDHQRQAVAGSRCKGLRSTARGAGVVVQLQLALLVERVDQLAPRVGLAGQRRQHARGVGAHLVAHVEHPAAIGRRAGQDEEFVVQQIQPRYGCRSGGASSQQDAQQQGHGASRHGLHRPPSASATMQRPFPMLRRAHAACHGVRRWTSGAPQQAAAQAKRRGTKDGAG